MPIFEIQGQDGIYEVDAPDERAAVAGFQKFSGGKSSESSDVSAGNIARQVATGVPVIGGLLNKANAATYAALSPLVPSDTTVSQAPSFGERYAENLQRENAKDQGFEAAHPALSTGLQMAGGVAGTLPLVAAAPAAFGAGSAPLAARAGASAATGAALGGADAAARGQDVATGAGTGFALGAISPYAAAGIGKAAGSVAGYLKPAVTPSIDDLKAAADAAYKRVDNAGVQVNQQTYAKAVQDIANKIRGAGLDPDITPKANAALNRLEASAGLGINAKSADVPTLGKIDLLRQVAGNAAGSIEKADSRLGSKIVGGIDDFVDNLQPSDLASGSTSAIADLNEARSLWASNAKAEMIRDAITRAENRAASTGSGGNVDNAIRQNLRAILDNPKKSRGLTPDERSALQNAVTAPSKVLRTAAKLAPNGNGLMAFLQLGSAVKTGGATIPLAVAGTAAKAVADRATKARADALVRTILNGGTTPVSPLALSGRDTAEKIARAILSPAPLYANQRR